MLEGLGSSDKLIASNNPQSAWSTSCIVAGKTIVTSLDAQAYNENWFLPV